jgi:hypothetical protein
MGWKRHVTRGFAFGLAIAGWSGFASDDVFAEGGRLTPGIAVGSYIEDRRDPVDGLVRFTRVTLIPSVGYIAHDEGSSVVMDASRRFTVDPQSPFQMDAFSESNTTDHAGLHARRVWSDLYGAFVDAGYSRSPDLEQDPGRLVGLPGAQTGWYGMARGSRWRLDGGYHIEGWEGYLDVHRHAGQRIRWDASLLPIYRRDTALLLGWRQFQIDLAGEHVIRAGMAAVGYRRALTPLISGEIEAGPAQVDFADGSRWRGPGVSLAARGPGFDRGYARGRLTLLPGLPWMAEASVDRPVGSGRISLNWESGLTPEAAIGTVPNLTRQLILAVEDTLTRADVLHAQLGVGVTRPNYVISPVNNVFRLAGWIERRMRDWMSASAGLTYMDFRTQEPGRPSPVKRLRFDLLIAAHP